MKKLLLYLFTLGIATSAVAASNTPCDSCDCKATSQTFFTVRPPHQLNSPERLTLFRDRMAMRDDGFGGAFQLSVFGGRSTHSDDLARYFLPNCQTKLTFVEGIEAIRAGTETDVDVIAQHFNIHTVNENFKSVVEFKPQHSFFGVGFEMKKRFKEREDGRAFWFRFATQIERVKNTIELCEEILSDGGGVSPILEASQDAVASVVDAFKQSRWDCGKIDFCGCDNTKTKLADIDISIGYEVIKHDGCYMDSFLGVLIPTGNSPEGKYLFEPMVGHNKHFGILFGSDIGLRIWEHETEDKSLWFELNMHGQYLFSKTEKRFFDLKCKPWSRYMQVFANFAQAQEAVTLVANGGEDAVRGRALHTPGINCFCQDMKVKPRFTKVINTGFVYTNKGFQGEIGYNFYCRQAECVELKCPWVADKALKNMDNEGEDGQQNGPGTTTRAATIGELFIFPAECEGIIHSEDNYNNSVIKAEDLDLNSAAHPCVQQHTIYASLGHRWDDRKFPLFVGAGGSYDFPADNTGMHRWMVWGKVGVSF